MVRQENTSKKRNQRDYSLAFKLQVVGEIERGELNYDQADRKYGIRVNLVYGYRNQCFWE